MDEHHGHILVAEDELIVAHSIQMRLEHHGYVVDGIAKSGEEAIRILESARPDLILMDIRLSGEIDGIELAERIRHEHQIPVIFLTAYSDDATLERAKITEPFGYIIKPFETRELINSIEIALYRRKLNAALQTSEARFRGLFENAVIGLVLLDHAGHIIEANRTMLELVGQRGTSTEAAREALRPVIEAAHARRERVEQSITRPGRDRRLLQISSAKIPQAPNSPPYTALFVEDVTELRRYEQDLQDRQRALRALFFNEETIRERERTRLSRDIHDVLGQMLTAHKMDLHWIKSGHAEEDNAPRVDEMLEHIDGMIGFVKRVCSELRDSVLDDFGFDVALNEHVKQFTERVGVRVDLEASCGDDALGHDLAVSLLRIIQEALTNVARHAGASVVKIRCVRRRARMIWTVEDDGVGFDMAQIDVGSSLGIIGMNERAASWGGSVDIASEPGRGTIVRVEAPTGVGP